MTPQIAILPSGDSHSDNLKNHESGPTKSNTGSPEVFFQRLGHKLYAFTVKDNEVYWVALTCEAQPGL